jgi:hypothetical protein
MERTPTDLKVIVEQLRRWYYSQHPDERDRLLWQRFLDAKFRHVRLVQAQAEREIRAARPLPATIEQEATGARPEAVRH